MKEEPARIGAYRAQHALGLDPGSEGKRDRVGQLEWALRMGWRDGIAHPAPSS